MWQRIKTWLGGASQQPTAPAERGKQHVAFQAQRPDLADQQPRWLDPADSPFGVRVLDVRPVTLGRLSVSADPQMASNAVSYGGETGHSFAQQDPLHDRPVAGVLRFAAAAACCDGALFIPTEMEDKWALFVQSRTLIVVRGWQRRVFLRAALQLQDGQIEVRDVRGAIWNADEPVAYTLQALDFLLRTHALRLPWPAPLLDADRSSPEQLAIQCMSGFGRQAHFACVEPPPRDVPKRPLRTMTALHVAALRSDLAAARAALESGVPVDLPDPLGATALSYVADPGLLLALLIEHGADVNRAADDGTTPLMAATQHRRPGVVQALLSHAAQPDTVDARGFSALHRAAELGEAEIVASLLSQGADPDRIAAGQHTPRSLAQARGHLALFSSKHKRSL